MYSPREFFETQSQESLREFLFDAFERHSLPHHANQSEMHHALEIKKSVVSELSRHNNNKAVSHEMWAVATMVRQFQRQTDPTIQMPEVLGPAVYNNPAFADTLIDVREYLRTLDLKRA